MANWCIWHTVTCQLTHVPVWRVFRDRALGKVAAVELAANCNAIGEAKRVLGRLLGIDC